MRRHLDGSAHLLACGCNSCREALEFRFNDLVFASFTVAEESAIDIAAEQTVAPVGDGNLSPLIRERIAAYSGPFPNTSA